MLGRCPRSSLHRTTSKRELHTQNHEIVHLPNSEDEKPVLQPPHQVVIGFDLGADSSRNLHAQACESPRSVLESHRLCFRSHHQPLRSPRSPLSALGSLLSDSPPNVPCTEGAALCLKAAIKAEKAAASSKPHHTFSRRGFLASDVDGANAYRALSKREHMADHSKTNRQNDPVTSSRTNNVEFRKNQPCNHGPSDYVSSGSRAMCPHSKTFLSSYGNDQDNDAAAEDADSENLDIPASIFSTASPVANYFRSDSLAIDFLSECFLCRRHLVLGKDIYMYRGDRAFCSQECRYQQIVVDERKERRPAAVNCVSGASSHHQRLQRAKQAAVA